MPGRPAAIVFIATILLSSAPNAPGRPSPSQESRPPVALPSEARPAEMSPEAVQRLSGAGPDGPVVRVGITTDHRRVTISSDGAFRVLDPVTRAPVWKESYREDLLVTTHGARPSDGRVWRVQAASLGAKEESDALATTLEAETGEEAIVSFNPDRGSWRVRVGSASAKEAILPVLQKLRALGYPDAWAADEPVPAGPAWLRLVDSDYATIASTVQRALIEPAGPGFIMVDGKRYRGSFEILVDGAAGLQVVNVLPLEAYLRGVVPAELGPALWPEIEALKAQAVAARTYAVRNLGRFADEGYDLCDSPRCQVYAGAGGEHPLSDRAIRETAGNVAEWHGAPINALFTSTCGGHTEDGGEIFPEEAAPWLRGVACAEETSANGNRALSVDGVAAAESSGPADEVFAVARLIAAGIVGPEAWDGAWRDQPLAEAEARALIERAGRAFGGIGAVAEGRTAASRLGFPLALADRLDWAGEAKALVQPRDLAVLLPFTDAEAIPASDRLGAGAAASRELLPRAPGGALRPSDPLERAEAVLILDRAATAAGVPECVEGTVAGGSGRKIQLRRSDRELLLAVPRGLALFLDQGRGPVAHQRLALYPGDRIRTCIGSGGEATTLVLLPGRKGLSDDRWSPTWSWQTAMTDADLSEKLSDRLGTGRVTDLIVLRRGVSGRVVALKVVGERGEAMLTGFNVRSALGLKESLFALDRQRGPGGRLSRVVFSGKGWGHGVGMCQMGAYGMAARGASWRDILKHYYTGIDLARIY